MKRVLTIIGLVLLTALLILIFNGCAWVGSRPKIKGEGASVIGVQDGTGAKLDQGETKSGVIIPAGTPTEIIRHEAVPATDTTPFQPAREEIRFVPKFNTELKSISTRLSANSGGVDTTVALRRIDVAENRILLFVSIGAALAAGFFVYIKYPTPAMLAGVTSIVFFLAWKLADLPPWFWVIGVGTGVGAVVLWRGHERGEKDGKESVKSPTVSS